MPVWALWNCRQQSLLCGFCTIWCEIFSPGGMIWCSSWFAAKAGHVYLGLMADLVEPLDGGDASCDPKELWSCRMSRCKSQLIVIQLTSSRVSRILLIESNKERGLYISRECGSYFSCSVLLDSKSAEVLHLILPSSWQAVWAADSSALHRKWYLFQWLS